ncbi:hypothetical protein ScPMuIL_002059 [Solemya velum]
MANQKRYEITPLLPSSKFISQSHLKNKHDKDVEDQEIEMSLEHFLPKNLKKERVSLCLYDCVILTLQYLQILALIQSMALRWVWPEEWLSNMYFLFFFNFDFWEILKMKSGSKSLFVQDAYIPSSDIPEDYFTFELTWLLLVIVFIIVVVVTTVVIRCRYPHKEQEYSADVQRVIIVVLEIFAFPIGVHIFRLFQCTSTSAVFVDNELSCFQGTHLAHVVPGLILALALFVVYPVYLVYCAWKGRLGSTNEHHETNLLLKEAEFLLKVNSQWLTDSMFMYSSFKLTGIFQRPAIFVMKLALLIVFSAGFSSIYTQALSTTIILSIFLLLFIVIRPYRLTLFNVVLIFSQLCLVGCSLLGTMIAASSSVRVTSAWLLPQYSVWILVAMNGAWLLMTIVFSLYLLVYAVCYGSGKISQYIWPTLKTSSSESRKFVTAILRGKLALVKARSTTPMFANVHELVHQIKVVNAYLREAEFFDDNLHSILMDLLDELIETHSDLVPQSLFSDSIKASIQETSAEFVALIPSFARRLAQRDYDFILVSPQKKRILLKMFILGIFLNGRKQKIAKHRLNDQALETVWQEPVLGFAAEEDGYFEDLYPDPLEESFSLPSGDDGEMSDGWVDLAAGLPGQVVMEADLLSLGTIGMKSGQVNQTFVPSDDEGHSLTHTDRHGSTDEGPYFTLSDKKTYRGYRKYNIGTR